MSMPRRAFLRRAAVAVAGLPLSAALVVPGASPAGALAQEQGEALWLPDYLTAREAPTMHIPTPGQAVSVDRVQMVVPDLDYVQLHRFATPVTVIQGDAIMSMPQGDTLQVTFTLHLT